MIEESLAQGAVFTVNWGMTEVGPCAINRTFYPGDLIPCYQDYFLLVQKYIVNINSLIVAS